MRNRCTKSLTPALSPPRRLASPVLSSVLFLDIPSRLRFVAYSLDGVPLDILSSLDSRSILLCLIMNLQPVLLLLQVSTLPRRLVYRCLHRHFT
jgi:hypothetical protein